MSVSWLEKSCQFKLINGRPKFKGRLQNQQNALFVVSEDQSQYNELEIAASVPENNNNIAQDISSVSNPSFHFSGSDGKSGLISFYNRPYRRDSEILLSNPEKSQNSVLWFVGPAVLVASFIFPSLYLRKLLSVIFEDSLLTGNFSLEERLFCLLSIWCYIALSATICIAYYFFICGVFSDIWMHSVLTKHLTMKNHKEMGNWLCLGLLLRDDARENILHVQIWIWCSLVDLELFISPQDGWLQSLDDWAEMEIDLIFVHNGW